MFYFFLTLWVIGSLVTIVAHFMGAEWLDKPIFKPKKRKQ